MNHDGLWNFESNGGIQKQKPWRMQDMGLPHIQRETDVEKAGLELNDYDSAPFL